MARLLVFCCLSLPSGAVALPARLFGVRCRQGIDCGYRPSTATEDDLIQASLVDAGIEPAVAPTAPRPAAFLFQAGETGATQAGSAAPAGQLGFAQIQDARLRAAQAAQQEIRQWQWLQQRQQQQRYAQSPAALLQQQLQQPQQQQQQQPASATGPAYAPSGRVSALVVQQARLAAEEARRTASEAQRAAEALVQAARRENEHDAARRMQQALSQARNQAATLPGHNFDALASQSQATAPHEMLQLDVTAACGANCNGHGTCEVSSTGEQACKCAEGWRGAWCDSQPCASDCTGRGTCVGGQCLCSPGFAGDSCERKLCPQGCSNHGYCFEGRCQCTGDWGGESCMEQAHAPEVLQQRSAEVVHAPGWASLAAAGGRTVRRQAAPAAPAVFAALAAGGAGAMSPRAATSSGGAGLLQASGSVTQPLSSAGLAVHDQKEATPPPQINWPSLQSRGQGLVDESKAFLQPTQSPFLNSTFLPSGQEDHTNGVPVTASWLVQQGAGRRVVAAAPMALVATAQGSTGGKKTSLLSLFRRAAAQGPPLLAKHQQPLQAALAEVSAASAARSEAEVAAGAAWPPLAAHRGPHQVMLTEDPAIAPKAGSHSLDLAQLLTQVAGGVKKMSDIMAN